MTEDKDRLVVERFDPEQDEYQRAKRPGMFLPIPEGLEDNEIALHVFYLLQTASKYIWTITECESAARGFSSWLTGSGYRKVDSYRDDVIDEFGKSPELIEMCTCGDSVHSGSTCPDKTHHHYWSCPKHKR